MSNLWSSKKIDQGEDCILIAGCGWGKSLVYQLSLLLWPDQTIVIICPLNAISDEQQEKLEKLGIRSISLKQETKLASKIIDDLANGVYKAVFMSPEIIFKSKRFKDLWGMPGWRKQLRAITVDEAHCISTWGKDFRTTYSRLGDIRSKLPPKVPFIALSATLPTEVLTTVIKSLHFKEAVTTINTGNDRTNIRYEVSYIRNSKKPFKDLECVLDFKKTIVYVDNIYLPGKIHDYFKQVAPGDIDKISVHHAQMSPLFKSRAMEGFRNGSIRVLLSTEAAGMGCDIGDVVRVIQYGLPTSIISLMQRIGRAACDPRLRGIGRLLIRPCLTVKDPELSKYVISNECRRRVFNDFFGNKHETIEDCCDICCPSSEGDLVVVEHDMDGSDDKPVIRQIPNFTDKDKEQLQSQLREWRSQVYRHHYKERCSLLTSECIMTDDIIDKLVSKVKHIVDKDSIKKIWTPLNDQCLSTVFRIFEMVGCGVKLALDAQAIADVEGHTTRYLKAYARSEKYVNCMLFPIDSWKPIDAAPQTPISDAEHRCRIQKTKDSIEKALKRLQSRGIDAAGPDKGSQSKQTLPGTSQFCFSPASENDAVVSSKRPQSKQTLPGTSQFRILPASENKTVVSSKRPQSKQTLPGVSQFRFLPAKAGDSSENTQSKRPLSGSFTSRVAAAISFQDQCEKRRRTESSPDINKNSQ